MRVRQLTQTVRHGLILIDSEMGVTADTMDDRPADQAAIRAALSWIDTQVWRIERQRAKTQLEPS